MDPENSSMQTLPAEGNNNTPVASTNDSRQQIPTTQGIEPVTNEVASTPPLDNPNTGTLQLFDQIVEKIIEQQEAIIGPVAVEQAKKVRELKINWPQHLVDIDGNPQQAIDELVAQYKELFGQIAVQVSKEAVAAIMAQLPADQQPKSLQ